MEKSMYKVKVTISKDEVLTYSRRKTRAAKPGELDKVKPVLIKKVEATSKSDAKKKVLKLIKKQRLVVTAVSVTALAA